MADRTYICATCNTPFQHGGVGRPPKDCTSCRDVDSYACEVCGRSVQYVRSRAPHKRCKECRVGAGRCGKCGAQTKRTAASGPPPGFCSPDCERANHAERKRRYMSDPEIRQRTRDRERSDLRCKDCGREVQFQGVMRKVRCADCWPTYESRRLREKNWRKLGIVMTAEQYAEMQDEQDGCCAICGKREDVLHVDHCHSTNRIRALLCGNCNRGLGMFADDPARLAVAAAYLERTTVHA